MLQLFGTTLSKALSLRNMDAHNAINKCMSPSFKLKGSLFTLSVLQLLQPDLDQFARELALKKALAPKFFDFTPMVVDVQALALNTHFDFKQLRKILTDNQIIPVGLRGLAENLIPQAKAENFALMHDETHKATKESKTDTALGVKFTSGTKIIEEPIRSGQQIYAQDGDLIIVGSVSAGAELMADGNIHVYGVLRGRALAGANGNIEARIFCQQLAAELVSIAGHYQIFEHIEQLTQRPAQVYLTPQEELIIARL